MLELRIPPNLAEPLLNIDKIELLRDDKKVKLKIRKLLIFIGVYILIIIVTNLIYALTIISGFDSLMSVLGNLFATPLKLTFCRSWPQEQSIAGASFCTYNYGYILLNIYFATVSYFLVIKNKLPLFYWAIGFIFLNLLVLMFIRLKDFLYAGI